LTTGEQRAAFLERVGEEIMTLGDELIARSHAETGLPEARLIGERARTVAQLRLFAQVAREGSWVDARIDHAIPDRQPAPKPDLRRMLIPIGPVVVFGSSNFPLAFSGRRRRYRLGFGDGQPRHRQSAQWAPRHVRTGRRRDLSRGRGERTASGCFLNVARGRQSYRGAVGPTPKSKGRWVHRLSLRRTVSL
jgi:hypothetical protein